MRLSLLVVLALLLSGCSGDLPDEDAADGPGSDDAADDDRTSMDGDEPLQESVAPPTVVSVDGTLMVAAHPAPGQDVQPTEDPYHLEVDDDVRQIYMELVWPEAAAGQRLGMTLRAISESQAWHYGGAGSGAPDDPDVLLIDDPDVAYDVVPVADEVVVDQSYTIYISLFDGKMPDGYTAVPQ